MTLEQVLIAVCAALLAGNLFFIKRLIDKIDSSSEIAKAAASVAQAATAAVSGVANQLREIKAQIADFRRIEIDVAVLKAQFVSAPRKRKAKPDPGHDEDTENGAD